MYFTWAEPNKKLAYYYTVIGHNVLSILNASTFSVILNWKPGYLRFPLQKNRNSQKNETDNIKIG